MPKNVGGHVNVLDIASVTDLDDATLVAGLGGWVSKPRPKADYTLHIVITGITVDTFRIRVRTRLSEDFPDDEFDAYDVSHIADDKIEIPISGSKGDQLRPIIDITGSTDSPAIRITAISDES